MDKYKKLIYILYKVIIHESMLSMLWNIINFIYEIYIYLNNSYWLIKKVYIDYYFYLIQLFKVNNNRMIKYQWFYLVMMINVLLWITTLYI